jgi:hypothetical protein
MKSIRFMLVLFAAVAAAFAQESTPVKLGEVKMSDGRVYKDVVFVSESPTRITVRHEGGLAQLDKKKLPDALKAKYPADEAAAERERIEREQRRIAAAQEYERTRPQREAQTKALREQRMASVAFREAEELREEKQMAESMKRARTIAQDRAEDYFRTTWKPGNNSAYVTDSRARIDSFEAKQGWPGQWTFSGEGYVEYYLSSGRSFGSNRVNFVGDIDAQGRVTITPK